MLVLDLSSLPTKPFDFGPVAAGNARRKKPVFCRREDRKAMFYRGKENAIYGETESGKDMLLAETVFQALDDDFSVYWIEFEEGDGIDLGNRLMEMGISPKLLCDQDKLHFVSPENIEDAKDAIYEARTKQFNVVIFNGVQAMYAVFGWELADPSSPAMFRQLIQPILRAGCAVIETDHMNKSAVDGKNWSNGSRYAAGGIAKLNWINGAAYLLVAVSPIIRGSTGSSRILLTKDRPGNVKPFCLRKDDEPRMMNAGTMVVKSARSVEVVDQGGKKVNREVFALRISIKPPSAVDRHEDDSDGQGSKQAINTKKQMIKAFRDRDNKPMKVGEIGEIINNTDSAVRGVLKRDRDKHTLVFELVDGDKYRLKE
jgi:hypothetical protein